MHKKAARDVSRLLDLPSLRHMVELAEHVRDANPDVDLDLDGDAELRKRHALVRQVRGTRGSGAPTGDQP